MFLLFYLVYWILLGCVVMASVKCHVKEKKNNINVPKGAGSAAHQKWQYPFNLKMLKNAVYYSNPRKKIELLSEYLNNI
jgi:hypothetical protein